MKLTPSGRTAVARRRIAKDPNKVSMGVARAQASMEKGWDPAVRSSRLGYDCYATGAINGAGKIRVILRPRRLPPHLTTDVIGQLPSEMWWPDRDHKAAHALIDAVLGFDIGALKEWAVCWPDHEFGFERFLEYAERRAAGIRAAAPVSSPRAAVLPAQPAAQGRKLPSQFSLFPGEIESSEKLYSVVLDAPSGAQYVLRLTLVRFLDGSGALSTEIFGMLMPGVTKGALLCSRAYSDLNTGEYEILAHRPGRLKALGLPLNLLHIHLGIKGGNPNRPTTKAPEPEAVAPMRTSPNESATMTNSRHVQAVLAAEGPTKERYVRPPETVLPMTGAPEEDAPMRFPDAPVAL